PFFTTQCHASVPVPCLSRFFGTLLNTSQMLRFVFGPASAAYFTISFFSSAIQASLANSNFSMGTLRGGRCDDAPNPTPAGLESAIGSGRKSPEITKVWRPRRDVQP